MTTNKKHQQRDTIDSSYIYSHLGTNEYIICLGCNGMQAPNSMETQLPRNSSFEPVDAGKISPQRLLRILSLNSECILYSLRSSDKSPWIILYRDNYFVHGSFVVKCEYCRVWIAVCKQGDSCLHDGACCTNVEAT